MREYACDCIIIHEHTWRLSIINVSAIKKVNESNFEIEVRSGRGDALEPAAAVREPPAEEGDGNRREQRPPERQEKIGGEPEHDEARPENLFLHANILTHGYRGPRFRYARAAEEISGSCTRCEYNCARAIMES